MRLYIIRHGETLGNVKQITQGWLQGKLSTLGKEQAEKIAKKLSKESFDMVYCSDLRRCKQTIAPLLKLKKDIPIKYVKELRERNWGIFEGKKYVSKEITKDKKKGIDEFKPKGGESFLDVQKRVVKFFNKVFKRYKGKNVLFVTHGGTKRSLITYLLNKHHKKRHKKFRSENTALSVINIKDDGKHRARLINSIKHLEK